MVDGKQKIIFIVAHFFPLSEGVGNATFNLCRALNESGKFAPGVITPRYNEVHQKSEVWNGIEIWRVGQGKNLQNFLRFAVYAEFLIKSLYIIWKEGPQIVFAQTAWEGGVISAIAGKLFKTVSVVQTHGHPFFANRIHFLARWAYKNNKIVLATNDDYIDILRKNNWLKEDARVAVLPNAYFPPMVRQSRSELRKKFNLEDGNFHILFVGRLDKERGVETKGLSYAIGAVQKIGGCKLHVYGDGSRRDFYQKTINNAGLEDRVFLHGKTDPASLYEIMCAVDALLMPSLNEGLSMTMIEAMSASLPVIITKTSGALDYIQDGENGLFIEKEDSESIVRAVTGLKGDYLKRESMGKNGLETFKNNFSGNKIVEKFEKILQENYTL